MESYSGNRKLNFLSRLTNFGTAGRGKDTLDRKKQKFLSRFRETVFSGLLDYNSHYYEFLVYVTRTSSSMSDNNGRFFLSLLLAYCEWYNNTSFVKNIHYF